MPGEAETIIGSVGEVLAGAQVSFGRLDCGVAEQQLDLLEVAAGGAAELGAGAAQVMRPELQTYLHAVFSWPFWAGTDR